MTVSFEIVDDPARACAALMVGTALGGGDIVLTGGSTPRAAYQHFVEAVKRVDIDLSRTTLWIGDERCVDPDDDRSNYKMIKESLLDPLGDGAPRFERMKGELGPEEGADDYQEILRRRSPPAPPVFDLLLLGIGPDGHCASLFPGHPGTRVLDRTVIAVHDSPKPPPIRLSLTFPALDAAREVWFIASGEGKAEAVARALGGAPREDVPSAGPRGLDRTRWLLDEAAASKM